ncbi:hypothetical protein TNCV_1282221 [Trichonephila clavipes]|uniref:Uncharacterized protein n=1 Tax=Trichonephila clavipes TaxID=2585209 RepID=A0A8X6VJX7_TRICX|nr:hypothetical protein TNCV_1282221 [Trichonephila clavipes]
MITYNSRAKYIVVVSNPLGAGKPTPCPFDLFEKEYPKLGLDLQTTVQGNTPAVQKMNRRSKERVGTGKERLYPLDKGHIMQVTASKAHQGRLKSPGSPAL